MRIISAILLVLVGVGAINGIAVNARLAAHEKSLTEMEEREEKRAKEIGDLAGEVTTLVGEVSHLAESVDRQQAALNKVSDEIVPLLIRIDRAVSQTHDQK